MQTSRRPPIHAASLPPGWPRALIVPAALCACAIANAQAPAAIGSIRFEGNEVTQGRTLERELALSVGDPADPAAIEASRQAILDLGLFRQVEARSQMRADGAVDVIYTVREKRYLLVVPRLDGSSDEDRSYGAQLRWANVGGLNHRLNLLAERGEFPEEERRSDEESLRLSYEAPYAVGRDLDAYLRIERLERTRPAQPEPFQERFDRFEIGLLRNASSGRPRRGWIWGGGLSWERQDTAGTFAPAADGRRTALVGRLAYRDVRERVYSESGSALELRLESAHRGLASDYSYQRFEARWFHARDTGRREHEQWIGRAELGWIAGGRDSRNEYGLGGSGQLRGYPADFAQGNRYAYGTVEYTRPLHWDWLRGFIGLEVGAAGDSFDGSGAAGAHASLALGVRVRLTWFVDVEFEAGIAQPLRGGDGARFFAGGN